MSTNIIDRIHNEVDIVQVIGEHVALSKKGQSFVGLCPFHPDKTPSMFVSPSKQVYNCFSCGNKGDVITFIAEFKKIPRAKAIGELAKRIGLTYEIADDTPRYTDLQKALIEVLTVASAFYQNQMDLHWKSPYGEYAARRGLDNKTRDQFKIGLALKNDALKPFLLSRGYDEAALINAALINQSGHDFFANRLVFALTNEWGDVVGFSGRTLDNNDAKYLNSTNSVIFSKQHHFYNYFHAKDAIAKLREVYICEGQMDVIALSKSGFTNAVAIMGTALTSQHLRLLLPGTKVIINFDSDAAGVAATLKSLLLLLEANFTAVVVVNENGKDADETYQSGGATLVKAALAKQVTGLEFAYHHFAKNVSPNDSKSVNDLITALAPFLAISPELERELIISQLAQKLTLEASLIRARVPLRRSGKAANQAPDYSTAAPAIDNVASDLPKKVLRYTYGLLLSMLKKPSLINYYKEHRAAVLWAERQLELIADFLVAQSENRALNLSPAAMARLKTIESSTFFVTTEAEMAELISHVRYEYYDYFINRYKAMLKNDLPPEEIDTILKTISEYKKKKEELN